MRIFIRCRVNGKERQRAFRMGNEVTHPTEVNGPEQPIWHTRGRRHPGFTWHASQGEQVKCGPLFSKSEYHKVGFWLCGLIHKVAFNYLILAK